MNSMDQGTGKFMRKFSKDKAKIESISLRKNRWVPIAFILAVSCWIRCGSTQNESLRVDRERRYQISDVDLSDHRAMVVQLNLLIN